MEKFFVRDFSATALVRILKFGTKLDSDELYCVTKEQPHIAHQSIYLFIFLSLRWKFLSQISQFLLEPVFSNFLHLQDKVYCVWKLRCNPHFAFTNDFFLLSLLYNTYGHFFCQRFLSRVRTLKFGTKLDSDKLYCVRKEQPHIAQSSFFFLSNVSVTDFSAPIGGIVFKFCVHLQEGKVYCVNGN